MADDSLIQDYQKSLDRLQIAERQVGKIVKTIQSLADKLNKWKQLSVSNVGVAFPAEITYGRSQVSVNGNDWPSAKYLAEILSNWHQAWHDSRNAYRRIPEYERTIVQPPPER